MVELCSEAGNATPKTHTIGLSLLTREPHALIAWCTSLLRKIASLTGIGRARAPREEADAEIREVFFAELRDVTRSLQQACAAWRLDPSDQAAMKALRRGFHTLKGSAPLVGATALSDFSGRLEKLTARILEQAPPASPDLIAMVEQAVALLPAFAVAIRDARPAPAQARSIDDRIRRLLA